MLANQIDAELRHGQIGFPVALMDTPRLGLQQRKRIVAVLDPCQALAHAIECPEQIDRGRPRIGQ
ncbi:hypothetical protein D3C80_1713940 [compost metagenome]